MQLYAKISGESGENYVTNKVSLEVPDALIKENPNAAFALLVTRSMYGREDAQTCLDEIVNPKSNEPDDMTLMSDLAGFNDIQAHAEFESTDPDDFAAWCNAEEWMGGVGTTREVAEEMHKKAKELQEPESEWEESLEKVIDKLVSEDTNTLVPETGTTRVSIANAKVLLKLNGKPTKIRLRYDPNAVNWYEVACWWPDGDTHVFKGLSWGYRGEGPHGLEEVSSMFGLGLDLEEIAKLPNEEKFTKSIVRQ